jgi:cytochrome c peroxidase
MTTRVKVLAGIGIVGILVAIVAGPRDDAAARDAPGRDGALVELGRRLFFDPAIGRRGRVACAACHDPEHGFSDARPRSQDEDRELPRHSQSVVDLAGPGFHWDGDFDTVRQVIDARTLPGSSAAAAAAERALSRMTSAAAAQTTPIDAAAVSSLLARFGAGGPYGGVDPEISAEPTTIARRIALDGRYDAGFAAAFGDAEATSARIGDALEAYLLSLRSAQSPFDRFAAGERSAISESARRGAALFRGEAGCAQCHVADGPRPRFTDGRFHNTGVASRGPQERADAGRLGATFFERDRGAFKTPSLRDVARRAPYFHDASMQTLADVVRYYAKGGTPNAHLDPLVRPRALSDRDVDDLVSFLESLTGDERPGLGRPTALRSPRLRVHVDTIDGAPAAGRVVKLSPFGDRVAGAEAPSRSSATTDDRGDAVLDMPASTHCVVEVDKAPTTRPLPDWTTSARVVVVPPGRAALLVRSAAADGEFPSPLIAYVHDAAASGGPARFVKVRDLGAGESLYVSDRLPTTGAAPTTFCLSARLAEHPVDLASGVLETVDLRPRPSDQDISSAALRRTVATIRALSSPKAPQSVECK